MISFITIRFLDILDIFLVAFLLYQVYRLIKGTVAFNIVLGLFSLYLFWLIVRALNMELTETIMGQFISVGVLALIIVFHPEIRRFLIYIGSNYNVNKILSLDKLFNVGKVKSTIDSENLYEITDSCRLMSRSKTGALIVITRNSELIEQINTGDRIIAKISSALLNTIFFKNAPLHDGAVIIKGNKIIAARCILPLTQKKLKSKRLGLRHRAAIGITENSDAVAIVVSEERGTISFARKGNLKENISIEELSVILEKYFIS